MGAERSACGCGGDGIFSDLLAAGSAFCISIVSCLPMSPVERVWRVLVLGLSDRLSFLLKGNNFSLSVYLGRELLFETDISMKMIHHTDISKYMQKIPSFICRLNIWAHCKAREQKYHTFPWAVSMTPSPLTHSVWYGVCYRFWL